jgi:magnesium chelatase family protein
LDRIDLQVELKALTTDERFAETKDNVSSGLRARVEAARERQNRRFSELGVPFNAAIPGGRVRELCRFGDQGFAEYKSAIDKHTLSTRSMDRLAKVARTVADLVDSEAIEPPHVRKAASYVIGGLLRDAI